MRLQARVSLHVLAEVARTPVPPVAHLADVGTLAGVYPLVDQSRLLRNEGISAVLAHVRPFLQMHRLLVIHQRAVVRQLLTAFVALHVNLVLAVRLLMMQQGNALREYLVADVAPPYLPVGGFLPDAVLYFLFGVALSM